MKASDFAPLDSSKLEDRKQKEIEHSRNRRTILQGYERRIDTHSSEEVADRDRLIRDKAAFETHFANVKYYSITGASQEFQDNWLRERCKPGFQVLDFACGNGENGIFAAQCGANVIGIDISPEGVENSNKNAVEAGVSGRCEFVAMDGENMAFPDKSFDLAVEYGALHHVDLHAAMKRTQPSAQTGRRNALHRGDSTQSLLSRVSTADAASANQMGSGPHPLGKRPGHHAAVFSTRGRQVFPHAGARCGAVSENFPVPSIEEIPGFTRSKALERAGGREIRLDHGGLAQESDKAPCVNGTTPVRMGGADTRPRAISERVMYRASKRMFDLVGSLAAVLVLFPLLVVIALAIRLDSRGPVFYKGVRTGIDGAKFRIWKFRTMTVDAESKGTTTVIDDKRITRVGGVLRHTKLDELPQFFNVVAGSMSIVGPRPEVDEHTSEYSKEELAILTVKPGITDFASLRFFDMARELGSDNPHEQYVMKVRGEKNLLRMKYVKECSFLTDLKIVCMTIGAVVRRFLGLA